MKEVNTALESGRLQNGGNIMPTLAFRRQLAIKCMEITIGKYPGDIGSHMQACIRPHVVEFNLEKVPNYHGKWSASEKKSKYPSRNIKSSATRTIHNVEIEPGLTVYAT